MTNKEIAGGIALVLGCWVLALGVTLSAQGSGAAVCALDLVVLKPIYQVDATMVDGSRVSFCNSTCAWTYLEQSATPVVAVTVYDEESGESLEAGAAFYVESEVYTHRESSNRIHVFGNRSDAERHGEMYQGRLMECPFSYGEADSGGGEGSEQGTP